MTSYSVYRRILIAIAIVMLASVAAADARRSESEREVLARAVQELDLIDAILADAERRVDSNARIYFDYGQLRSELAAVKGGVSEYVGGDRLQPRAIESLTATYTRIAPEK